MEGVEKKTTIKVYEDLAEPEKIRAILGNLYEPCTKEQVIELSSIDYESMDEGMREAINNVFSEKEVDTTESEEGKKYILNEKATERLNSSVDKVSVNVAIADSITRKLESFDEPGS
jgi:hypothetical protein